MEHIKRIVGLTGGMGAGKSTLVQVIKDAGIPVYDVDAKVHQLYENPQIADYIGEKIGLEAPVTRQMVAAEITRDPSKLPTVEQLMMQNLEYDFMGRLHEEYEPFLVIDAPLLFEMGWNKYVDVIIAIQCPREIREERVMSRPGMNREKMKLLMDKQVTESFRLFSSQYIIRNTGTVEEAQDKMRSIIAHLKEFYA